MIINHLGEIILFKLTSGNVVYNNHNLLQSVADNLQGFLFGDKGYLSKITDVLRQKGLHLIAKPRAKMKVADITPEQKYYMRHRGIIEIVFDILKNISYIEHTRNQSTKNYWRCIKCNAVVLS